MSAKLAWSRAALLTFLIAIAAPIGATVDPGRFPPPSIRLTMDAGASLKPRVALDADGNAVVVWQDDRYGNNEILWQKFGLDGVARTSVARVTQTAGSSARPDVACGADSSYVVWQEGESNGVGDVYFARLNPTAVRIRPDLSEISLAGDPRVASLPGGWVDVVWWRRANVDQDLYYRQHRPSGAVQCQQRLNDGTIADIPKTPVIAVGGDTNARLLWSDLGQFFSYYVLAGSVDYLCAKGGQEICGVQGVNPTIDLAGTRLAQLYQYGGRLYEASGCCAVAGTGSASLPATGTTPDTSIAVWQDTRDGNAEIYFCQYRGCTNLSGDLRLTQNAGASERPDIAVNPLTGEWAVVWQQVVDGNYEIYLTSSRLLGSTRPFLIPSATFDKRLYHNGTDVATIKVMVQSTTGNDANMTLHATLSSNVQDVHDLGFDPFTLTPQQQHVSTFSWPVPARAQACNYSLHLELAAGATVVATADLPKAIFATNMTDVEIDQKNAEVMNDACVPAVSDCASYWIGVIPIFNLPTKFTSFKDAVCASGQALSHGDVLNGMKFGFLALLPAVEIALEAIPGVGTVPGLVVDAVDYAFSCAGTWFPYSGPTAALSALSATDPNLDSLSVSVRSGLLSLGRVYADQLFMAGGARLRIGVNGSWTTADSAAITHTFVFPTLGNATRWAHIGPQPVPVGGAGSNPHSEVTMQIVGTAAGPVDLRVLHHPLADSLLRYATIPMLPGSVARLTLSDTSTAFPLLVDLDGNGTTDYVYLPGSAVLDVPPDRGTPALEPGIVAIEPNPFSRATTVTYRLAAAGPVRFEVFDVSGRKRAGFEARTESAGVHAFTWDGLGMDGARLTPGAYFLRLRTAGWSGSKLIVAR